MKPITDPALLAQLEQTSSEPPAPRPVTDPALLAELERPMPQMTAAPEPTLMGELGQAVATLFGAGGDDRPVLARLDDAAARTRDALIPDALQRGWVGGQRDLAQTLPAGPAAQFDPEGAQAERDVYEASLMRERERYTPSREIAETQRRMSDAQSVGDWAGAVADNPAALLDVVGESMGRQALPLLVNAVSPWIGVPATMASSFNTERLSAVDEAMAKAGVDLSDPAAVAAFQRQNPEIIEAAERRGKIRGAVIAPVDAATAGVAGRFFRDTGLGNALARTVTDAGIGVAGGVVGETGAQLAADGGITSLGDILTEGAAEGPSAVVEGASNVMGARRGAAPKPVTDPAILAELEGQPAPGADAPRSDAIDPEVLHQGNERIAAAQQPTLPTPPPLPAAAAQSAEPAGPAQAPEGVIHSVQSDRSSGSSVAQPAAQAQAPQPQPASPAQPQQGAGQSSLFGQAAEDAAMLEDPLVENNASGESSASIEAINRVREEREAGRDRVLIDRDGSVRPLTGVDAVDTFARDGQVIVQRGVGRDEWTVLSSGTDLSPARVEGIVNRARPMLSGEPETATDMDSDERAPGVIDLSDEFGAEFEDSADGGRADAAARPESREALLDEDGADGRADAVQTDSPAFRRWFKKSQITEGWEGQGEPRVLYHATRSNFDAFRRGGDATDALGAGSGPVIFLGTDPADLRAAHNVGGFGGQFKDGANVMPLYASIQNPLYITNRNDRRPAEVAQHSLSRGWPVLWTQADVDALTKAGYDGAVIFSDDDAPAEVVAFRPEQIKSATANRGTFDPASPNIMEDSIDGSRGSGSARAESRTLAAEEGGPASRAPQRPARSQRGRGSSPEIMRVSFTNRRSWAEQAFADAGVDPDQATLWPIERQFDVLSKLVKDRFGVTVKKTGQLQGRMAVDQLLDLYRNMQFMAHTLGMPNEGMGLGGRLHLLLRKGMGYFGAFYPAPAKVEGVEIPAGTIALPRRSNSFAHEWMHALDHYLAAKMAKEGGYALLSKKIKGEGIDAEPGSAAEAFVAVLDNLFHDQAALAAKMLALQNAIDTGSPSVKAKAEVQMRNLMRGNGRPSVEPTDFRTQSASFGKADYWASPEEMLARAFEAYTAFKVEAIGGSTEAIAKGDMAYLSNADERLAKTFPKAEERNRIFAAFDRLFEQMAKEQLIAQGIAAGVPGNMQIFDPLVWDRTPARKAEYAGIAGAVRETIDQIRADHQAAQRQKERPTNPKPIDQRVHDVLRYSLYAMRSVFRMLEKRYPNSRALRELADNLVTAPGHDRVVKRVFEEAVEQRVKQAFNRLGNIVQRYGLEKLDSAGLRVLRDLLISEDVPNAPANVRGAAVELRKFLDAEWYRNQQAGIDIGYARNGYLPRLLDMARVMTDGAGFVAKAAKVYEIIFDNEIGADVADVVGRDGGVRAFLQQAKLAGGLDAEISAIRKVARQINRLDAQLKNADDPDAIQTKIAELSEQLEEMVGEIYDQVRESYGRRRANDWLNALKTVDVQDFDAMSPDASYTKNRKLPPEADKLLEDFYIADPIEAIQTYMFQSARRTEYATRFGPRGEKLKELFDRMADDGVSVEDQAYISDMVKALTGRWKSNLPPAVAGAINFIHALGTMTLLPRAVWSSFGEPTAASLRTGNIADGLKPYLNLFKMTAGSLDAKQWVELSRAIGAISSGFADTVAANRFGGTFDSTVRTDRMMSRFFKRSMLSGLTNAQRASIVPISHQYLMGLAANIRDGKDANNSRALLAELGIEDAKQFSDWLLQNESIPDVSELYDSNGIETKHGAEYMTAVNRFLDQTIQNPKGYDRPLYANNPIGRLMYGILSFSMSFWGNVWKRQGALIKGIAERKGVPAAVAYTALQLTPSMLSLFLVQTLFSTLREAIFNPERWEEWEKKGTLAENLLQLGFTRSFSFGLVDPVIQGFTGLKYQRDLSNIAIGAVPGFVLQSIQNVLQPLVRNSEKTNNAEFKSVQGAYQLLASPAIVYALSMVPGGRLVDPLYGMGMMYLTSPGMRDRAATAIVGEKDSARQRRERAARAAGGDRFTGRDADGGERTTGR